MKAATTVLLALGWRLARVLARDLPHRWALQLGRLCGLAAWWLVPVVRCRGRDALRPFVPGFDRRQRTARAAAGACAQHLAFTLRLDRWRAVAAIPVIDPWRGLELLRQGPGLLVTIHADWDVVMAVVGQRLAGRSCAAIVRPDAAPFATHVLSQLRASGGFATLPWPAARPALRHLRDGGVVGVLADRPYGEAGRLRHGRTCEGQPYTWRLPRGPLALAEAARVPLVPVIARLGRRPLLVVGRPIRPGVHAADELDRFLLRGIAAVAGRWLPG